MALNRTRLKEEILDHFQKYGIQEQYDGRHVRFLFPKEMWELLQNTILKSETLNFEGKFPASYQKESVPYTLKLLVSMILNGPGIKNEENSIESQSCLILSQLILFSTNKKSMRHSHDQESPISIYTLTIS